MCSCHLDMRVPPNALWMVRPSQIRLDINLYTTRGFVALEAHK